MHVSASEQFFSLQNLDEAGRKEFWASLSLRYSPGIGSRLANMLVKTYGSAYKAVFSVSNWTEMEVPAPSIHAFRSDMWRKEAKLEWDAARHSSCKLLLWTDPKYPLWLKNLVDAPLYLYFYGDIALLSNIAVAIVGARECSMEGMRTAIDIARGLSAAGVTVVSGLARGIDRAAHLGALEGPGSSIAVLGTGVDVMYPKGNQDLRALMMEKGLIVSELSPDRKGSAGFFPVRNRIISGISKAVVVAEAASRSGSLNTAHHALDQNRELLTVPGSASAKSFKGCQELIRKGAKAVFCADDVLRELLPELTEHAGAALAAREKIQLAQKKAGQDAGEADGGLAPGLLPWQGSVTQPQQESVISAGLGNVASAVLHKEKAQQVVKKSLPELYGIEGEILSLLQEKPMHIDDISRTLRQNASSVSSLLTMLEVKGYVRQQPGMFYARTDNV